MWDTEYTSWEGCNENGWNEPWQHKELLQIGAIKVDTEFAYKEIESFDLFIKPQKNPELSDYIQKLTGISQQQVDSQGFIAHEAMTKFKDFCGDLPIYSYGHDWKIAEETARLQNFALPIALSQFHDISPVIKDHGIDINQYTSGEQHQAVNITMDGHTHNALHDVRSIAVTLDALNVVPSKLVKR